MCYDVTFRKNEKQVHKRFNVKSAVEWSYEKSYHARGFMHPNLFITPSQYPGELWPAQWGLVPSYAHHDPENFTRSYTLNAKVETLGTARPFKESAKKYRCLIIADGFFEPHHVGKKAYPFFCHYKDDSLFAFAGVYSPLDSELFTCAIVTTEANEQFSKVHNKAKRMPLVLDEDFEQEWLRPDLSKDGILEMGKFGFTKKEFECYPISRDLYDKEVHTNVPSIITHVPIPGDDQLSLF